MHVLTLLDYENFDVRNEIKESPNKSSFTCCKILSSETLEDKIKHIVTVKTGGRVTGRISFVRAFWNFLDFKDFIA